MIQAVLGLHDAVRYAAVYQDDVLEMDSRPGTADASAAESDRYEELIVNPAVLTLARQRGNIDCGGLKYVVIRYGSFFQLVHPTSRGHVSVCVEKTADPVMVAELVEALLLERGVKG